MRLFNGTIRPGSVMEVLENGNIKASAPGLFNFGDDPEKMPPIMPWFIGSNCNAFSKLKKHDEVWIMNFDDNPRQLYWFRKDRLDKQDNLKEVLTEQNVEILCNRDVAGEWCSLYFSDGSGWIMSKDESIIQIDQNGNILLDTGFSKRCIGISPESISLGAKKCASHPAAYGDGVVNAFLALVSVLKQVQMAATPNPHTTPIATVLANSIKTIEDALPKIVSSHVTLE